MRCQNFNYFVSSLYICQNYKVKEEALCKFNEEFIDTLNDLKDKKGNKNKVPKDQKELKKFKKC